MLELNRLYNLDCMQGMREFPDGFFDLAIVDPPYGIGIDGQRKRVCRNPKHNRKEHSREGWDSKPPTEEYFRELERVSRNQVIWGGNYFVPMLKQAHKGWLIWDKGQRGLSMSDCELAYTSFDTPTRIFTLNRVELQREGTIHPTQKPVKLYEWVLSLFARKGIKIRTRKGTKSMKKTMTRILTLALALAMSASVLAGCSDNPEPAASGSSTESTASEDAAGGERAKLTAMIVKWSPLTKDVNEMQWLKNVAEAANVEVEWQQESSDWNDKKNAVFSSGNIPDVLFSAAGDAEFTQYPGLFEDMGPLIDQYAPNVKEMFETYPEIEYACKDMEGKTYTLPRIDGTYEACKNYASMFINKTWLDNLGLEIPTTWDELEQVLIAFNEQDPNGNGDPNDEIPMDFIWNDNTNNQYGPANMLGGTGMPLSNGYIQGFFAEDGEVKCWYTDERFQSLLIYLQGLWNQGLINEAAFTNDYSQYQALARGEGTTAKVGFTFGWNLTDRFGNELADQYVVLPPLKADDSLPDDQLYYVSEDTFWGKGVVSMSASCENKEAAMRFINQFYDYDVSLEVMYGGMNDVDNCIVKNDDGTYEVLPPKDSSMDPSSWQWTNTFVNNGGMWVRNDVQVKTPVPDLTLGEKETYLPYQESIPTNSLFKNDLMKYSQEDQNTLAMVETNLGNIWDPQVANWITGTNDIATEWEAYVDSLKNAGLDQALEIKQAAFDTYLEATGN